MMLSMMRVNIRRYHPENTNPSITKKPMGCRPPPPPKNLCLLLNNPNVICLVRDMIRGPCGQYETILLLTAWSLFGARAFALQPWWLHRPVGAVYDPQHNACNKYVCGASKLYEIHWVIRASLSFNAWIGSLSKLNTFRPRQMDAISQTTFSNGFSWMKIFEFWLKFHWSLFPRIQLIIFHHWSR